MTTDRPVLGIFLMLGFCVAAPLGDAIAKILGESVPLGQLILVRFGVQAMVLIPIALLTSKSLMLRGRVLWLTVVRTGLHIIGIGAMFTALRYLPLADAVAIAFVMPFIMLILAKYFLNEEVGPHRIMAAIVGFAGTLLVIQPSFVSVGWPALWPLVVAVVFALFMLVTRQIAQAADPIALQAVSGVIATFILIPIVIIGNVLGISAASLTLPAFEHWGLLVTIGLLGTAAHLLMTWALRFAPSATLAPMQYLEIPIATVIGWWVFSDLPNALASVGIAITIGAGLYVIWREHAQSRR